MKKILLLTTVLAIGALFLLKKQEVPTTLSVTDSATPSPTLDPTLVKKLEVKSESGTFSIAYTRLFEGVEISLKPNFTAKKSSKVIASSEGCLLVSNGGFYTTTHSPIGLFISEYEQLNSFQDSSLFDGVISVNDFETPRITRSRPNDRLRFALQSGPILIENSIIQKLNIRNDSDERRAVAGVTGDNKVFLAIIYKQDSVFSGPKLGDLPEILSDFGRKANLEIADAINLDGGTASALYSNEVSITEASPIGSYFCISPQILL